MIYIFVKIQNRNIKSKITENINKIFSEYHKYTNDDFQQNFKNETLKIFIMTHKDFVNYRKNPVYSIVVDDKSLLKNTYNLRIIYADRGKLYKLNRAYSEMSQLYYIYQLYKSGEMDSKYIGLNHYRRYFEFKDNIPNLDEIFKNYDVILNTPYIFKQGMKKQFCDCHFCKNYDEIIDIIKDIKPEYYESAIKTINLTEIHYCNLFIMKKNDFYKFCEFMFDILFEFDRRHNFTSDKDVLNYVKENFKSPTNFLYQSRIQAFLSERIGNIFYFQNFKKIKTFRFGNYFTS